MTASLNETTRKLLQEDVRCDLEIHKGSGVSFYWIGKYRRGEIKSPSVDKVQSLYEFLAKKPLLPTK